VKFFIILFKRAFQNDLCFIVIVLLVAELFGILIYAGWMGCDVAMWARGGVKSQKFEYLTRLSLSTTET